MYCICINIEIFKKKSKKRNVGPGMGQELKCGRVKLSN